MSIPKATGIETEYAIVMRSVSMTNSQVPSTASSSGRMDVREASRLVVGQIRQTDIVAAPQQTMFVDIRLLSSETAPAVVSATDDEQRYESEDGGWMLANGARIYVDHAHPEYCTPECLSARDLVAADKAGERILERCCQLATVALGIADHRFLLYKNNSDHKGNSYGCHENYLLSRSLYEDLLDRRPWLTLGLVIPFFISRTILCGAGKVGSENGTTPVGFQLSQRADFFETLTGVQTTHQRPLFNTRNESHADDTRFRRLHVIIGDANMAEYSTFLKVGTAQIFLRMLEDGFLTEDFALADPLQAMRTVSRDLTLRQTFRLQSGADITAVQLQQEILTRARQYVAQAGQDPESAVLLDEWAYALDCLKTNWRRLANRLDWAIKRTLLEKYLERHERSWDKIVEWQPVIDEIRQAEAASVCPAESEVGVPDPVSPASIVLQKYGLSVVEYKLQRQLWFRLRRYDLEYHDIRCGPEEDDMGLFYQLQHQGAVMRLLRDDEIERLIHDPPGGTRAQVRGNYLKQYGDAVVWADWSGLRLAGPAFGYPQGAILRLEDPLADRAIS